MFVKVCGLRNVYEMEWAVELGYSAAGIVVYEKSRRFSDYVNTLKLINFAKGNIKTVVVSLYLKDVEKFIEFADFIQVYEQCNIENLIYCCENEPVNYSNFRYLLYDKSRGKGIFDDIPEWVEKYSDKLIIAGGLNSVNVKDVAKKFKPFGVDVSSGVEKNGVKDYNKMKRFIETVNSL